MRSVWASCIKYAENPDANDENKIFLINEGKTTNSSSLFGSDFIRWPIVWEINILQ